MTGTDEEIYSMNADELIRHRREQYKPENAALCMTTQRDYFIRVITAMADVFKAMSDEIMKNGKVRLELNCELDPPKVECFVISGESSPRPESEADQVQIHQKE